MAHALRDDEILDAIRILASKGESGRLQITAGMTEGAVFIDKGNLVDARFGKLTGFQAINAVASIRDATFTFDPSLAPSVESSITPNERILLKEFFGIGAPHHETLSPARVSGPDDIAPAQVVPLSEVEDQDIPIVPDAPSTIDTPHFVPEDFSVTSPSAAETVTSREAAWPNRADATHPAKYSNPVVGDDDEVTLVKSNAARAERRPTPWLERLPKPGLLPALFLSVLTIVLAVVAAVLVYQFRKDSSSTPVAGPVPTSSPDIARETQSESSTPDPSSVAPDLTGNWQVVNTIEQTSYQPYRNLKIGFDVAINQNGKEFTGKGEKVSENGQSLPGESRTPILVKGSINGDKVEATFSERGAARKTSGRFVWNDRQNKWRAEGKVCFDRSSHQWKIGRHKEVLDS